MSKPFAFNTDVWPGLCKVVEETNELGVELAKVIMVGGDETKYWGGRPLRQNILEETADVFAALSYFTEKNFSVEEIQQISERVQNKREWYEKWEKTE